MRMIFNIFKSGSCSSGMSGIRACSLNYGWASNVFKECCTRPLSTIFGCDVFYQYVKNNNIKMVAMSSRKYSFLDRLFTRHNVEKFGYKIRVPYLVMEDTGEHN